MSVLVSLVLVAVGIGVPGCGAVRSPMRRPRPEVRRAEGARPVAAFGTDLALSVLGG